MKCLLDTNFFLLPSRFKVDIFERLRDLGIKEVFTLDLVVNELEKISFGKSKDAKAARLGLELIEKKSVKKIRAEPPTDTAILKTAKRREMAIATQDIRLRARARMKGIRIIYLRQRKILQFQ